MEKSSNTSGSLKRAIIDNNPAIAATYQPKRMKREKVSKLKRYLICCAHLIYVKKDPRKRDPDGNLVHVEMSEIPTSELSQEDLVTLYFDGLHRSIVSQSKSKKYSFAAPDWLAMESYLFPWISLNTNNHSTTLTRKHIKHMAFRIWEYLANQDRVVIKYKDNLRSKNVPLGDVRGWWWVTDGKFPLNYRMWKSQHDGYLPGMYNLFRIGKSR